MPKKHLQNINRPVLKRLFKLLFFVVSGVLILYFPLYLIFSKSSEDTITITGMVVEQQVEKQLPISNAEVRWVDEELFKVVHTNQEGKFELLVPRPEKNSTRISFYHPNYRPKIDPVEIKQDATEKSSFDLKNIQLIRLVGDANLDADLLNRISVLHNDLKEKQQQTQELIGQLEKQENPELAIRNHLSDLKLKLRLVNNGIQYLMEDSLLYTLREITKNEMLISLENKRADYAKLK